MAGLSHIRPVAISVLAGIFLTVGAMPAEAQRNRGGDDELVVAPIGGAANEDGMTRTGLETAVRRFADRFLTSVSQTTNQIRNFEGQESRTRLLMHQWKTVSSQAIIELAIGQDPVTSLLDMMVLTTLSRLMIDEYWGPTLLPGEEGELMSSTYAMLEADIWSIGAELLTAEQIETLRVLIDDWYRDNPDQTYPWYIRLNEFSDQRAASLQDLDRGGGLFGIREATDSIAEVQAFGERVLFYMQRAPTLMSYELETSIFEVLAADEVASLIENTDQFSASVQEMVEVVAGIPSERLAAIDQLMEQLGAEREALMTDLRNTGPEAEGALEEVRLAMESLERILVLLDVNADADSDADSGAPGFDITDYQALVIEAGVAANELTELLQSFESVLGSPVWENSGAQATAVIDRLVAAEERLIQQLFFYGALLIGVFFASLIAYRLLMTKVLRIGQD